MPFRQLRNKVSRFPLHFLKLQVPMVLGALVCYLLTRLIPDSSMFAMTYYPGSFLYMIGDILFLTVPVVIWMTFHGHSWRFGLEMAVAMIVPVAAIIVLGELAEYNYLLWLLTAMYPAMCLGMSIYMLFHIDYFNRGTGYA